MKTKLILLLLCLATTTLLQGCVNVYEERYAAAFDFEIDLRVPETLVP